MPTLFYTTPSDTNKEKFVRDALIELYSASDAPVEIDEVELSEPQVEPALLLTEVASFDISYTTEVGYHRQEQYVTQEKYYDSDLKQHRTRNVIKERTVTDWQPYQGTKKGIPAARYSVLVDGDSQDIGDKDPEIAAQYRDYSIDVEGALKDVNGVLVEPDESNLFFEMEDRQVANDVSAIVSAPFFHRVLIPELPGDENRNFNCDWTPTEPIAAQYLTDRYKLAFDYNGHKCFVKQCTVEEHPNVYCSYKHVDEVAEKIISDKKSDAANDPTLQKTNKIYKALTLGSLAGFVLAIGLSGVIGTTISVIALIASIGVFAFAYLVYGKNLKKQADAISQKYDHMLKEHKDEIRKKKIAALEKRFATLGLKSLSEEERHRFFEDHKLTDHFRS